MKKLVCILLIVSGVLVGLLADQADARKTKSWVSVYSDNDAGYKCNCGGGWQTKVFWNQVRNSERGCIIRVYFKNEETSSGFVSGVCRSSLEPGRECNSYTFEDGVTSYY